MIRQVKKRGEQHGKSVLRKTALKRLRRRLHSRKGKPCVHISRKEVIQEIWYAAQCAQGNGGQQMLTGKAVIRKSFLSDNGHDGDAQSGNAELKDAAHEQNPQHNRNLGVDGDVVDLPAENDIDDKNQKGHSGDDLQICIQLFLSFFCQHDSVLPDSVSILFVFS